MKKTAIKILLSVLAVILITSSFASCAEDTGKADDNSFNAVLAAGRLVVGIDSEYPPMSFVGDDGEATGFDVEFAKAVCEKLGVTLTVKPIDWDKKEDLLNGGDIDCIWSGLAVTAARAEKMLFSEPYIKNEVIFVVKGDSDVMTVNDLKGKKVGVQAGSSPNEALVNSDVYKDVTVVRYPSSIELLQGLKNGIVDAAVADSLNAYYYIFSSEERFFVLSDCLKDAECAVGFRKGDMTLRDRVQKIMGEMKADGTLADISAKWFGSDITIVR